MSKQPSAANAIRNKHGMKLFKRLHLPRRKKTIRVAGRSRAVVTTTIGHIHCCASVCDRMSCVSIEKCPAYLGQLI